MRVIAIVTCYHPTPELLLRSVASYASHVDKLLIWRNSILPPPLELELSGRFNAEFRGDGTNAGIPAALNAAWQEAVIENYDCLLTMDQDSIWHEFEAYLSQASTNGLNMCFYSPTFKMRGETLHPESPILTPLVITITSGMLVPISVLNTVGGWDENFRIDAVDVEFCLHARSLGIQGWRSGAGWLEHQLGDRRQASFLGLHFYTYNYSAERLYSTYRNHIIAFRRYKGPISKQARKAFVRICIQRQPIRILLGEKDRWNKILAIIRGIRDGFKD